MRRVARLFVYPVKSLPGIELQASAFGRAGLARDRRFMIVDENGVFVTQRAFPGLSQVPVSMDDDGIVLGGRVRVPWNPAGRGVSVDVWSDRVEAVHAGDEAAALLSDAIGKRAALVHVPDAALRPVDPAWAEPGDHTGFADGFPVLVLGTASLDDLSRRLGAPVDVRRFRPNVVVETAAPWEEDAWGAATIAGVRFRLPKPCSRCVMTTVDPDTGEAGKEPLKTLATFRARDGEVWVGMNGIPDGEGTLRVGDAVAVG